MKGQFRWQEVAGSGYVQTCPAVDTQSDSAGAEPLPCECRMGVLWGAHWRHMANTIEPSMCGGDAT